VGFIVFFKWVAFGLFFFTTTLHIYTYLSKIRSGMLSKNLVLAQGYVTLGFRMRIQTLCGSDRGRVNALPL